MHYIFAAVWGHQVYRLFGMLVLAFVMLVLVTSFITVSCVPIPCPSSSDDVLNVLAIG